tara:strand:+ start:91 stop:429 length:339 start_codon:yes stop_codon:yes gene_type:complete
MAEAFARRDYPEHNHKSAGIEVAKPGDIVPIDVWQVMMEKELDLKHHRRTPLTPEMICEADKVYVLCGKEECPDYLISFDKAEYWPIADPIHGYGSMVNARDDIEERVGVMF